MDERLRTLLLLAAGAGAGFLGGATVTDADLLLADGDRAIVLKGATAAAHQLSLRAPVPAVPDGAVELLVYGSVRDSDGGVHDMGEMACALTPEEQLRLYALMQGAPVKRCAAGDSGVPSASVRVHAVDLRRRAKALGDGGAEAIYEMEAFANRALADGGLAYPCCPSACAVPDAGQGLFDRLGLACFRRGAGLGR